MSAPCPTCHDTGVVERAATPDEVDEGCELGIAFDPCPNDAHHFAARGCTCTPPSPVPDRRVNAECPMHGLRADERERLAALTGGTMHEPSDGEAIDEPVERVMAITGDGVRKRRIKPGCPICTGGHGEQCEWHAST